MGSVEGISFKQAHVLVAIRKVGNGNVDLQHLAVQFVRSRGGHDNGEMTWRKRADQDALHT